MHTYDTYMSTYVHACMHTYINVYITRMYIQTFRFYRDHGTTFKHMNV